MAERAPAPSPPAKAGTSRRGGLATGILIGILLGIAMALAVAVWLNVRGSPFSEREAPAELPPLKLPSSPAPPAPATAGADVTEPTAADAEAGAAEAARGGQRFDFYEILPSTDPAAGPQPRANLPVALYLQAGAFRNPTDADDRKAQLNLLGQTAVVQRVQTGDGMLHRIRVGPFANPAELDRARAFLSNNGIESIPMRPEVNTSQ